MGETSISNRNAKMPPHWLALAPPRPAPSTCTLDLHPRPAPSTCLDLRPTFLMKLCIPCNKSVYDIYQHRRRIHPADYCPPAVKREQFPQVNHAEVQVEDHATQIEHEEAHSTTGSTEHGNQSSIHRSRRINASSKSVCRIWSVDAEEPFGWVVQYDMIGSLEC